MKFWQAIILGIVHGFAELLPVSGSGHMKILERVLALPAVNSSQMLLLSGMLHLGTVIAVVFALHRYIFRMLQESLTMLHLRRPERHRRRSNPERRLTQLVLCGTVPVLLALFLREPAFAIASHLSLVAAMLILNGLALFFSGRYAYGTKDEKSTTIVDAMLIGLSQVVAVVPGISRIGIASASGMWRDLKCEFAVIFAYLLSVPVGIAIAIADITQAVKLGGVAAADLPMCLVAAVAAAVTGYVAIRIVRFVAQKNAFSKFAYYSWGAGIIALTLALFFV